jgi:hypothetical protein
VIVEKVETPPGVLEVPVVPVPPAPTVIGKDETVAVKPEGDLKG